MIRALVVAIIVISIAVIFYFNNQKEKKVNLEDKISPETEIQKSNIIENVEYSSKDSRGNEYIIRAEEGEIDVDASNIIYLKNVSAIIFLNNSYKILITADFGKYKIDNFDTIFSKNVIIKYQEKKINSEYLDFSILRNSMIISKNVIYTDSENTLTTDVIEINIKTKDIKFFMYDENNKVNLINQN